MKNKINGLVYADDFVDSGQLKTGFRKKQKQQLRRLTFRSFFISVLRRLHEKTSDKTNQKSDAETYSDPSGHLNEKIAGETNGKNRFANISYIFGKVLKSGLIKYSHQAKAYHDEEDLSNFIIDN